MDCRPCGTCHSRAFRKPLATDWMRRLSHVELTLARGPYRWRTRRCARILQTGQRARRTDPPLGTGRLNFRRRSIDVMSIMLRQPQDF